MLSRTASSLYWMGRYLERAEFTARILDVCTTPDSTFQEDVLHLPLLATGTEDEFFARGYKLDRDSLLEFLIWSDHPASLISSLDAARENARSVRSSITSEMWESINETWLALPEKRKTNNQDFCEWIRRQAYTFLGAAAGTMLRGESRNFLRLGTYLERADQTIRMLAAHDGLRFKAPMEDFYHWSLLLNLTSSLEAFWETQGDVPTGPRVLQVLLFHPHIPHSISFAMERVSGLLEGIGGTSGRKVRKKAAQICQHFRYDSLEEVLDLDLQDYLKDRLDETQNLASAVHHTYLELL